MFDKQKIVGSSYLLLFPAFIAFFITIFLGLDHKLYDFYLFAISIYLVLVIGFHLFLSSKITLKPLDIVISAYFLWQVVYLYNSTYSNQILYGFFHIAAMYIIYMAVRTFVDQNTGSKKSNILYTFILLFLVSAAVQCVIGILQISNIIKNKENVFLLTGTLSGIAAYSFFISVAFLVAVWTYLYLEANTKKLRLLKILSLITIFLIIFIIPHTQNRTSWLMILTGTIILIYFKYKTYIKPFFKKKAIKIVAGSIACIIALMVIILLYNYKKDSADGRLIVWKVTLSKLAESPIFGQGPNAVQNRYMEWQSEWFSAGVRSMQEQQIAGQAIRTYNDFLLVLLEYGIIGLLLYASIFIITILEIKKKTDSHNILFLSVVIAVIVGAMVSFVLSTEYIDVVLFILLGYIAGSSIPLVTMATKFKPVIWSGFSIALIIFVYIFAVETKRLKIAEDIIKTTTMFEMSEDYEGIVHVIEKDYSAVKTDNFMKLSYARALYYIGQYDKSIKILEDVSTGLKQPQILSFLGDCYVATKQYNKAEPIFKKEANMIPNKFTPLYKLVKLYQTMNDTVKALAMANCILTKPIKVNSPAIDEMKSEMVQYINNVKREKN